MQANLHKIHIIDFSQSLSFTVLIGHIIKQVGFEPVIDLPHAPMFMKKEVHLIKLILKIVSHI